MKLAELITFLQTVEQKQPGVEVQFQCACGHENLDSNTMATLVNINTADGCIIRVTTKTADQAEVMRSLESNKGYWVPAELRAKSKSSRSRRV